MLALLQTRDHIVGRVFTSRECAFYTTLVKILVNSLACTWSLLTAAAAGAGADWGTKHGNSARVFVGTKCRYSRICEWKVLFITGQQATTPTTAEPLGLELDSVPSVAEQERFV